MEKNIEIWSLIIKVINHKLYLYSLNYLLHNFKSAISMDEFIAQCIQFYLAGYDTTSTSLSMAAYCLAMNQETQDKLYEEAKEAFANEVERKKRIPMLPCRLREMTLHGSESFPFCFMHSAACSFASSEHCGYPRT